MKYLCVVQLADSSIPFYLANSFELSSPHFRTCDFIVFAVFIDIFCFNTHVIILSVLCSGKCIERTFSSLISMIALLACVIAISVIWKLRPVCVMYVGA